MRLAILMSAFSPDPKRFMSQLDSIVAQSTMDWALLIRFDGQPNAQLQKIARQYCAKHPQFIKLVETLPGRVGRHASLNHLIEHAVSAGFTRFALAEADGLWLETVVERAHTLFSAGLEDTITPRLISFDFVHTDSQDNVLSPAFMASNEIPLGTPMAGNLLEMGLQNLCPNPVVFFNKPAVTTFLPIPNEAISPSWWIAMNVCAHKGEVLHNKAVFSVCRDAGTGKKNLLETVNVGRKAIITQTAMFQKRGRAVPGRSVGSIDKVVREIAAMCEPKGTISVGLMAMKVGVRPRYKKSCFQLLRSLQRV